MGTWNSAIFGDDTACDVRDQFIELLSTGVSAAEAIPNSYWDTVHETSAPIINTRGHVGICRFLSPVRSEEVLGCAARECGEVAIEPGVRN